MWIFYYASTSKHKGHGRPWSFATSQTMSPNLYAGFKSHLMPRGRVEKRSAPPTHPVRRGASTASRQQSSRNRSLNATPLRRSARLADAPTNRVTGPTFSSMADVSSQNQFGGSLPSRSMEADYAQHITRLRSRRTRLGDNVGHGVTQGSVDGQRQPIQETSGGYSSGSSYALEIVSGPLLHGDAGQRLGNGLALQVRALPQASSGARMDLILGRLFAVATLVDARNSELDTPLGLDGLMGQLVETVQSSSTSEGDAVGRMDLPTLDTRGHMSFPELTICNPGTYRIRVTLFRVGSSSGRSAPRQQGVASVNAIETEAITIV